MMDNEELTLVNLGNGGAVELFDEELSRVLENILDPSTKATAKRTIVLKVTLIPSPQRDSVEMEVEAASKLAPMLSAHATVFVGRRKGVAVAVTHDPKQLQIQWDAEDRPKVLDKATESA